MSMPTASFLVPNWFQILVPNWYQNLEPLLIHGFQYFLNFVLEKTKLVPNFGTKLVPKFGTIFGSHFQNTVVFSVRKRRAKRKPFAGGTDGGHHAFWGQCLGSRNVAAACAIDCRGGAGCTHKLVACTSRAAFAYQHAAPRVAIDARI